MQDMNENMGDKYTTMTGTERHTENTKEEKAENEKYKAFVVMNGNGENDDKSTAIVIGQCINKIITSNDDYTNSNKKLVNVNNVINEASRLCLDSFKLIGNNVVRTDKIECLMEKMGSYKNDENNDNNNPVTNKFSTYYQRNDAIGGILLEPQEIANKYIDNNENENNENENEHNEKANINREHRDNFNYKQNYKKAKKYCAPCDELSRLEIREDIQKMRNPKMNEIKNTLKSIGFDHFINHTAYINIMQQQQQQQQQHNNYNVNNYNFNYCYTSNYSYDGHDDTNETDTITSTDHEVEVEDIDVDVQFLGINKNKKRNHNNNHKEGEPQNKRQKLNDISMNINQDIIKCNRCNKIFTLEVDLLLHKTNDKC